ncbi:uncharacterized protein LOC106163075 [Lingula anatina]|uniref:Uncharacterized protein LOC106163075 n=1 Tax=Lingula anatina TaxID=7574 RepID=A0A1S3IEW1_LINAN|nr:uncharacterized protein LOC106163075 [Lingula anatina]|eukprot:XP_013395999.1 uncharacterized protein LOC106163075 [Lingula anatina]
MERKGYQPVERLGGGEFGDVYLAKKGDKDYAVKVIKCTDVNRSAMLRELGIINNVPKHDNILRFDWFPSGENEACVVMEYCTAGDLNQYLLNFADDNHRTVYGFMHQLAVGLAYLHSKGLIHRDLKPEHVLIDCVSGQYVVKLSDFGLSKFIGKSEDVSLKDFSAGYAKTNWGTNYFMAPEVNEGQYDAKGDVFSLGLIYVAILCHTIHTLPDGRELIAPLVDAGGSKQPVWQFLTNNPNTFLPQVDQLSHSERFVKYEMASLIHYMLQKDPENRPPVVQVRGEVNRILYWDDVEDSSSERLDETRSSDGDQLDDSFEDHTLKGGEYECASTLPIRGDSQERDDPDDYEDSTLKRRSSTGDEAMSPQQRKKHIDDSTVRRARSAETVQDKSLNVHLVEFPDSCLLRSNSEFQYATLPDEHEYVAQGGQSSSTSSRSPTSTTDTNDTSSRTPPEDSFIQICDNGGEHLAQDVHDRLLENAEHGEPLASLTPDEDDGDEVFRSMNTSSVGSESVESIPIYYPPADGAAPTLEDEFDLENIPIGENAGLATLVRHFSEASASSPRRKEPGAPGWSLIDDDNEDQPIDVTDNIGLTTLVANYSKRDELVAETTDPNAPFQSSDFQPEESPTENDKIHEYPETAVETQPLLIDYETENALSLTTVVKNLQKDPNAEPTTPTNEPNAPFSSLPLSDQGSSDAIGTTTNDLGSTTSLTSKISQPETLNIVDRTPTPDPQSVLVTDAEMNFCQPEDPEQASTIKRVLMEREQQRRLELDRQIQIKEDAKLAQKLFETFELEKEDERLAQKIAAEERRPSPSQYKPRPVSQTSSIFNPQLDDDTQSLVSYGSPAPKRHRSRKDSESLIAVVSELSDTESLSGVSNLKRTAANAPPLSDISTGSDDVEPVPSYMDDNTPWSRAQPENSLLADPPYDDEEEYDCIDPDHKGYCWWCTCCLFLPLTLPSFFFYKIVKCIRKRKQKHQMKKQAKASAA